VVHPDGEIDAGQGDDDGCHAGDEGPTISTRAAQDAGARFQYPSMLVPRTPELP
jgi:hypothetical protein